MKARLPEDIREKYIRMASLGDYYEERNQFEIVLMDRGQPVWGKTFANREEMYLWYFEEACENIADRIEQENFRQNSLKWRYELIFPKIGEGVLVERGSYVYNAVEDTRLVTYETTLRLLKPVLSPYAWHERIRKYLSYLNGREFQHWAYDEEAQRFTEIEGAEALKPEQKKYRVVSEDDYRKEQGLRALAAKAYLCQLEANEQK
ncbi:MAG: hypothetical protein II920_02215 [Clostridia bacterium]|nr:hypothetical protein [Clostridia bacterium]